MPHFEWKGQRLFYRERGEGELLLVLPGNTASSACHDGELRRFGSRSVRIDEGRHRRERCPRRWARMSALVQQGHELWNGGERTPLLKTFTPNQRVLAHGAGIDLVRHFLETNRAYGDVVDRNMPLGHFADARERRTDRRNRRRQAGMLPHQRTACSGRCRRQPSRCRRRSTRRHRRRTSTDR